VTHLAARSQLARKSDPKELRVWLAEHAAVLNYRSFLVSAGGQPLLSKYVGRDEEAKHQQQCDRDEQLRRDRRAMVMVHLGAGGAADRAAALNHRAGTVGADQVLAAHLKPFPPTVPRRT
jgi:hypothetical protein